MPVSAGVSVTVGPAIETRTGPTVMPNSSSRLYILSGTAPRSLSDTLRMARSTSPSKPSQGGTGPVKTMKWALRVSLAMKTAMARSSAPESTTAEA